jgi:regulator of protease activity HflC (stomatin/prohibitin superfamily)
MRRVIFACGVLLCAVLLGGCVELFGSTESVTIGADEVGIQTDLRDMTIQRLSSGTYTYNTSASAVVVYSLSSQNYAMRRAPNANDDSVSAITSDAQPVSVSITVLYRLDEAQIEAIHQRFGSMDNIEGFIRSGIRQAVRSVVSTVDAVTLYNTQGTELGAPVLLALQAQFAAEGIIVKAVQIEAVQFSDALTEAIQTHVAAPTRVAEMSATSDSLRATAVIDAANIRATAVAEANNMHATQTASAPTPTPTSADSLRVTSVADATNLRATVTALFQTITAPTATPTPTP